MMMVVPHLILRQGHKILLSKGQVLRNCGRIIGTV